MQYIVPSRNNSSEAQEDSNSAEDVLSEITYGLHIDTVSFSVVKPLHLAAAYACIRSSFLMATWSFFF